MKEILYNMYGVFVKPHYLFRNDVSPNVYNLQYIGIENDKKNIKQDLFNFVSDFNTAINAAKLKFN
jgi:hypothetical protein